MSGFWALFWLAVVLKIPIVALLLIVWWAIREPPVPEADEDEGGGSERDPGIRAAGRRSRPAAGPTARPPALARSASGCAPRPRVPAGHR